MSNPFIPGLGTLRQLLCHNIVNRKSVWVILCLHDTYYALLYITLHYYTLLYITMDHYHTCQGNSLSVRLEHVTYYALLYTTTHNYTCLGNSTCAAGTGQFFATEHILSKTPILFWITLILLHTIQYITITNYPCNTKVSVFL